MTITPAGGDGYPRPDVKTLFRLAITVVVAGLGLAAIGVAVVPQVVQIVRPTPSRPPISRRSPELARRSIVFDAAGNQIDIFKAENREPFKISQVPKDVVDAVLAVEDESFYTHKGINAKSLVRAMLVNVSAGEVTQGGPPSPSSSSRTCCSPATATPTARSSRRPTPGGVEQQYSKDEILERYLNTVYLGNNAYGLQAAAETYFGKNVDQLDVWEGAFLAGLIRNPSGYDPLAHPERARARFKQTTERLAATGKVTERPGQTDG